MSGSHSSGTAASVLHSFTKQRVTEGSPLHRLDARAKIIGLIGFVIVVVSTPAHAFWAFALYGAILVFLVGLSRLPVGYVAKRALVVVPFVLVVAIFLPFFHRSGAGGYSLGGLMPFFHRSGAGGYSLGGLQVTADGLLVLWNVAAKGTLGVLSMILLSSTTTFPDMAEGFVRLRVPRVFVLIVSFMYRYSFVFVEELRRMQRAMTSRNYRARWLGNVPTLGHMLGALFLRSYHRGERVYVAMVSRGYEGKIGMASGGRFGLSGVLFVSTLLVVAVVVRVFASWGAA
jgi:cobalt/nickel transport system permease protein